MTYKIIHFLFTLFIYSISTNIYAYCFDEAGASYNVSPKLLQAIAIVESSLNQNAINRNKKSGKIVSIDYGLMQINSTWLGKLERYNIDEQKLLNDACLNVNVGAWILSLNFKSHGYNWNSIGAYNAGFSRKRKKARQKYINKVQRTLKSLEKEDPKLSNVSNFAHTEI